MTSCQVSVKLERETTWLGSILGPSCAVRWRKGSYGRLLPESVVKKIDPMMKHPSVVARRKRRRPASGEEEEEAVEPREWGRCRTSLRSRREATSRPGTASGRK
jgi:hypothetical protein